MTFFGVIRFVGNCIFGFVVAMVSLPIAYQYFPNLSVSAAGIVYLLAALFFTLLWSWYWNQPARMAKKLKQHPLERDDQF